ncbi:MAG: hypothetical protein GX752_02215 [Clostridium sp.]|nr:hypothetical protein [Clostridium sp.]
MKNNKTDHLLDILKNINNKSHLNKYVNFLESKENSLELSEYILNISQEKGLKKIDVINNANIYRTYGYEILNGKKLPSRNKLLQICIGNKFTLLETNKSLTLAKLGVLYAKDPRDSIIIYTISNKISLIDTNIILDDHEFNPLV